MSEPCAHQRADALTSFVLTVRDLAKAERGLCTAARLAGRDVVLLTAIEAATNPPKQGAQL